MPFWQNLELPGRETSPWQIILIRLIKVGRLSLKQVAPFPGSGVLEWKKKGKVSLSQASIALCFLTVDTVVIIKR